MKTEDTKITERPPIIAVMGHIDHGKSTLLSYIRQSSKPLNEAGGITQHISSYEVERISSDGIKRKMTFIDTPGHEAFRGIRSRGADVADIVILVVSAEDGVKPQTLEALSFIKKSETPFIVAINKIDRPEADINKTKNSLVENEIYIEGYGGDIPSVPISSKTGEGVNELLDMISLMAEMEELKGDPSIPGQGVIIESNCDIKKGVSATCIIKNGHIEKGDYIACGKSIAPIRIMENYLGQQIQFAGLSQPIKIIGWDSLPEVGRNFQIFKTKDEALAYIETQNETPDDNKNEEDYENKILLPIIIKADTGCSLEAIVYEINKLKKEEIIPKIISKGIGPINENDVRLASGDKKSFIVGFNVKIDSTAKNLAERNEVDIRFFDIIYKLTEWIDQKLVENIPKTTIEETTGKAKILKTFSKNKDKQILGGKVSEGILNVGQEIKIERRGEEIGRGKIKELQQQKNRVSEIKEGIEFGTLVESKTEISAGDTLIGFKIIEK